MARQELPARSLPFACAMILFTLICLLPSLGRAQSEALGSISEAADFIDEPLEPALNLQQTGTPATIPSPSGDTQTSKECVEPEPTFTGLEYTGPFKKTVVHILGKPDIKTVHHPHGNGRVCSLPVKQKFVLFAKDTFEPVTFIIAGFNAGIAQAEDDDPTFGQGMEGFGRRYGAAFADQVSGEFWGTFFFPTVLHEDPRYYRQGHGKVAGRLYHALEHSFVTHQDSGRHMFNFSEWMATTSTTALGNLYHPGNRRGFQPAARGVVYSVAFDAGFDVIREFWPEFSSHLHMPFISHTDTGKK